MIDGCSRALAQSRHAGAVRQKAHLACASCAIHTNRRTALPWPALRVARGNPGIDQGQLHIVKGSRPRQQIESLEDESYFFVADPRQFVVIQFAHQLIVDQYCPLVGVSRQPIRFMSVDLPEPEGP